MLRYEDLKRDTASALANVVAFLNRCSFRKIDSNLEALQRTIELSSPEKMRALEKEEAGRWVLTKGTRSDKPFVRSATSGGWKSQLAPESVEAIESAWGGLMLSLGYELVSRRTAVSVTGSHRGLPS
jgi:Sulfotransferase domain